MSVPGLYRVRLWRGGSGSFLRIIFAGALFTIAAEAHPDTGSNPDQQVAKVGSRVITAREFLERYEFLPWPQRHRKDAAGALKREFLYALIAEKLLAADALEQGMSREGAYRGKTLEVESGFVRDALYRDEVVREVKVTDAELWEAYRKSKVEFLIKALQFRKGSDAQLAWNLVRSEQAFDSIAADDSVPVENEETRNDTLQVRFGDYVPQVEDSLYALRVGGVTPPLRVDDHFYVIKLVRRISDPVLTQDEFAEKRHDLESILRCRKEQKRAEEFLHEFLAGTKGVVKGESLKAVAREIHRVLAESLPDASRNRIWLTLDGCDKAREALASRWSDSLLAVNDSVWTVGRFVKLLYDDNFSVPDSSMRAVRNGIDGTITLLIRHSYLTREGYRRQLQYDPSVREDMAMWEDNTLANILKERVRDTIDASEDEMKAHYQKYREELESPVEINIREVLLDNLQSVDEVMVRLDAGEAFEALARKYSERTWAARKGGEFGFFPVHALGDIGAVAAKLKVGERYGPLQIPEGYSIFEVIGKRMPPTREVRSFEGMRSEIRAAVIKAKEHKLVTAALGKLSKRFEIMINERLLDSLKVSSVPMMTYRYLGFGGRTIAVPFVERLLDWVPEWKPESVPLP